MGALSRIEELEPQRTTEALQARKQQGMPLGRPKGVGKSKLDTYQVEITALLNNGATKTWIARKYGTSRRNLSHWMKQHTVALEARLPDDQSCSETMPGKDELS